MRPEQYQRQTAALDMMNDLQGAMARWRREAHAFVDALCDEMEARARPVAGAVEHQTKALRGTGRLAPLVIERDRDVS